MESDKQECIECIDLRKKLEQLRTIILEDLISINKRSYLSQKTLESFNLNIDKEPKKNSEEVPRIARRNMALDLPDF